MIVHVVNEFMIHYFIFRSTYSGIPAWRNQLALDEENGTPLSRSSSVDQLQPPPPEFDSSGPGILAKSLPALSSGRMLGGTYRP